MSRKGGYKIIDFKNIEIKETATEFPEIYEEIEGNYGKLLILSGIHIDGVDYPDVAPVIDLVGDEYHACIGHSVAVSGDTKTQSIRFIIINDDDEVKYIDYTI